jgi:hypothetical protein
MGCLYSTPYDLFPKKDRVITPKLVQETLQKLKSLDQTQLIKTGSAEFNINFIMVDDDFTWWWWREHPNGGLLVPKKYRNGKDLIVTHDQIFEAMKEILLTPFTWKLEFAYPKGGDRWGYTMKIQLDKLSEILEKLVTTLFAEKEPDGFSFKSV